MHHQHHTIVDNIFIVSDELNEENVCSMYIYMYCSMKITYEHMILS
jgi:hypothetical protein